MLSRVLESQSIINYYHFPPYGDENGLLSVAEGYKNIPFDIKRVFYVYNTKKGVVRGCHAHYKMREVLIAVCGRCKISVDNAVRKETITLDSPKDGILVEPYIWREIFDFSSDCVLLSLASEFYDPADYINDYNAFLKYYANGLDGLSHD